MSLTLLCLFFESDTLLEQTFQVFQNLLSKHWSGFRPGDSCIYQLLAITHDIFLSFTSSPSLETRGVFLDISRAFDRV